TASFDVHTVSSCQTFIPIPPASDSLLFYRKRPLFRKKKSVRRPRTPDSSRQSAAAIPDDPFGPLPGRVRNDGGEPVFAFVRRPFAGKFRIRAGVGPRRPGRFAALLWFRQPDADLFR